MKNEASQKVLWSHRKADGWLEWDTRHSFMRCRRQMMVAEQQGGAGCAAVGMKFRRDK